MRDSLTELVAVRLSRAEFILLEKMQVRGGYATRQELVRSLIRAILDDDAAAHNEPRLPRNELHA